MNLTKEEFSLFNLKSRLKLLKKDGKLVRQRYSGEYLLVSLYSIYGFHIETTYDVSDFKTLSAQTIINPDVYQLYPP
ncbi:hypothetical protein N9544_07530 [Flavobacteriales bacterium]|nr:hypothetical protein [Flavobacteriales bacterium]